MSVRRTATLAIAAAILAGAGAAHAADATNAAAAAKSATKPIDFTVHAEATPASQTPTVKWDAERRKWGFTLNLQQPDTRASNWNDVAAGAYYRITPSLRFGGAFAFGDQQPLPGPKPGAPEVGQPRVQLETKFKF